MTGFAFDAKAALEAAQKGRTLPNCHIPEGSMAAF